MKRHSGNFYSHKCRLGVCPDLFFLLFSLAPFARTPTNAHQTVLRQERITFKRLVKKRLSFSLKMKAICRPLQMWPQGEVREARGAKRRWWKWTQTMTRWRFRPQEPHNILCCSFRAKCEMRVKSQQCFDCKLIRGFTGWEAREDYTKPKKQKHAWPLKIHCRELATPPLLLPLVPPSFFLLHRH